MDSSDIDYILELWLGVVPKYTSQFVVFSILISLLYSLSECVTKAIQATGKIKWLQIGISIIMLCELPIAWILMELGFPPYAVMWPALITYTVAAIFRFWLIHSYVEGYNFCDYFKYVIWKCFLVYLISFGICHLLFCHIRASLTNLIFSTFSCMAIIFISILLFGMHKNERNFIRLKISSKISDFLQNSSNESN